MSTDDSRDERALPACHGAAPCSLVAKRADRRLRTGAYHVLAAGRRTPRSTLSAASRRTLMTWRAEAIRKVCIERIVPAKGIDAAAERFDEVLMPTPAAAMEGSRLLAEGTEGCAGVGPLVVVDVGGATTDVHSVTESSGVPRCDGFGYARTGSRSSGDLQPATPAGSWGGARTPIRTSRLAAGCATAWVRRSRPTRRRSCWPACCHARTCDRIPTIRFVWCGAVWRWVLPPACR